MSVNDSNTISGTRIYFASLYLENVKCFSTPQELKLTHNGRPARWTLILGENGVGKTTLLQCLARMRPTIRGGSKEDEGKTNGPYSVVPELLGVENNETLNRYIRIGDNVIMEMKAVFSKAVFSDDRELGNASENSNGVGFSNDIETQISLERRNNRFKNISANGESMKRFDQDLCIYGYGAARRMGPPNFQLSGFFEEPDFRILDPVNSLFEDSEDLYDAEEILGKLDYAVLKNNQGAKGLMEKLKRALADVLPDIEESDDIKILGPRVPGDSGEESGVYVTTKYGPVPFSQISLGSRVVFAWIVDIAWRMFQKYPDSENPLAEPGIILVDEIDLHLHPRWQREIRTYLTRHFPNVQFIVTAHSPLMAQDALDANLVVLRDEGGYVVIENDPVIVHSWRIDQIVTSGLFGLPTSQRLETEKLILEREGILKKSERSTEDKDRLRNLDEKLDALPTAESPDDQKAMEIIRRAAALLKAKKEHEQ